MQRLYVRSIGGINVDDISWRRLCTKYSQTN